MLRVTGGQEAVKVTDILYLRFIRHAFKIIVKLNRTALVFNL